MTNLLILSAGTRNKVVEYCREAMHGEGIVVATDCSPYAPAIYEADACEIVPRIDAPDYMQTIFGIVKKYDIRGCFSLIDPELSLIAKHADELRELGCEPMISPYDLVETCLHKARCAELFKKHGLATAKYYLHPTEFDMDHAQEGVDFPVFVKPEGGSASLDIHVADNHRELDVLFAKQDGLMIQEFMNGQEYGADVYVDMISGKCAAIFLKKKLKMRAGETDKAVSVHDQALFDLIVPFVEAAGFRGEIDIDLFKDGDKWYFSEVNPRFGGGYPHAYACGVDVPSMLLRNLRGEANPPAAFDYEDGVVMMKYNEVMIRRKA